jgi:ferrous iron transport protein B
MKRVAIVGMPNTGKSTFFNRLTGSNARVANWPGITVDLQAAKIPMDGGVVEVVDLPGIYSLLGSSEDERVVRRFLEREPVNLCVVFLHAAQLDRQLAFAIQLKALGLPLLLLLNMADEARGLGVRVDTNKLSAALGFPVRLLSAKYGDGFAAACECIGSLLEEHRVARRARIAQSCSADAPCVGFGCCAAHGASNGYAPADALDEQTDRIFSSAVDVPETIPEHLTARLDRVLLHPWFGLPLFFATIFVLFELVYSIGTPLQDGLAWLFDGLRVRLLAPALVGAPLLLRSFLLDGVYNGVGTVLSFMPIIVVFFVVMAVVEDSGYLARAAFLMDGLMAKLGLDGRAFVIQLMGYGCNVPAILGTRVMRSRKLRLLTMLIVPFSLCSARLQVFVFLTTAIFSSRAAPVVLFSLYLASFATVILTALVWQGRFKSQEPMLLELPPYRMPTPSHLMRQAWHVSEHFLTRASGFIVTGVVAVWFLTHVPTGVAPASPTTLAGDLARWFSPVFKPLGIDPLLSVTLLFGFVAKEIVIGALAVIYGSGQAHLAGILAKNLGWAQAYSFMLFTLIYTPCLSTVAAVRQESGSWRFTLFSVGWSLALAWGASFVFYQAVKLLL